MGASLSRRARGEYNESYNKRETHAENNSAREIRLATFTGKK
jgi:hypothetical protein